ncbi:LysR family transcriptional regulator [Actinomadura rudentiformis]|uniref:LysR family transcriptional regulator n=1 Tax=Actinomadura rudentiformis TaxID=359158 RepID=A0A6H9YEB3_9ACTN|nr:LysR family transcriptional regulator [Actinomadura rudentiformis]KAB2343671.1 LysR family transcriptional regulator [Actinomadura rudentiformis]
MYTLDQLRGFVAVAEEGHFGRAAERLRMTQPPLSRQIQKLERAVGVTLLERSAHGAAPTPAGRAFLAEARRLLSQADAAVLVARRSAQGTSGTVRIAFTAVSALAVLGQWIAAAREHLPDVDLMLTEMVTRAQVDALLAGEIDVGLARGVPRSDVLSARLVYAEPLVLAVPRGHPLAELGRRPRLADIAAHELVTYAPIEARYLYELVITVFRDAGVMPRYVQQMGQVHSLLALVDAGVGAALVPRSASVLRLPNLEFLDVDGLAPDLVEVHSVWRTGNDAPALHALLGLVGR